MRSFILSKSSNTNNHNSLNGSQNPAPIDNDTGCDGEFTDPLAATTAVPSTEVGETTELSNVENSLTPSCINQVEDTTSWEQENEATPINVSTEVPSARVYQNPPSDLAVAPTESPTQPKIMFPSRKFGMGRPRSFNGDWYKSYQWLEYSIERDAAFCFPCRMLGATDAKVHLQ